MTSHYELIVHKDGKDWDFSFESLPEMFDFADRMYSTDAVTYVVNMCYTVPLHNGELNDNRTYPLGGEISPAED